jgi:hypothetical protein
MATWVEDVVEALRNLGGEAKLEELYHEVSMVRDEPLPRSVDEPVRGTIYKHSSDSEAYEESNTDYFVHRGSGVGGSGRSTYMSEFKSLTIDFGSR